ncbi:hypothetical protein [Geodermatophilus sp. URMC 62]|uniref:hypothetical protein n=1 Tax=Geodermatophilus sp. URMC 62 TaxID=3423414 RepID=UPI00406D06E6
MRRTVRTAAIVVGASAATGLGLATAGAQPDATTAQAPTSYQLTSSTMTVPVNLLDYPKSHGLCGDGYHVAGDWNFNQTGFVWIYSPAVHANGDSDIYIYGSYVDLNSQNGTDSNGRAYYQGLYVTLGNHSWTQAKQGSFTWTCEPN